VLASGVFTFILEWHYVLGYSDGIVVSAVPMIVFSLASIFLLLKAKKTFVDQTPIATIPETSNVEENIFKE
jgi:hypothetical protein